jgi:Uma2 family endonuclease
MLKYLEPLDWLPTAEDLPCSDETPVDSEIQERIPSLLHFILAELFADRSDWFFGMDMAIYYHPDLPPVVPDGFLSIGVDSVKEDNENLRSSYVLWEENGILPQLVIEVVSKNYRGEYNTKKDLYEQIGVLYYAVYNPIRKRKASLEIYRLVNGKYLPVIGNPVWMPEIGLGIGKERYTHHGRNREWMFWYDEDGKRYLTPQEVAAQERQQAIEFKNQADEFKSQVESEQARSQRLADRLRELGINPDDI